MTASQLLLREIKAGAKLLGIAPTTLCQAAVKNGHIIRRLEEGNSVTLKTADRIRAYIEARQTNETVKA